MYKKLIVTLALLALLTIAAIPLVASAHSLVSLTPPVYLCIVTATGQVDESVNPSTDSSLQCPTVDTLLALGAKGDQGIPGPQGTQGTKGDTGATGPVGPKGDTGAAGIPFSHAACTETVANSGSAEQENMVFCQSGIEPDGGLVYKAAIAAAAHRVMIGTPIADFLSVDWNGTAIHYVEFTSGDHAEYHADNVVRIYGSANQRLF